MCTMCFVASVPDNKCSFEAANASFQLVIETTDAPDYVGGAGVYTLSPGDSFSGYLRSGDLDVVRVWLDAWTTYSFDLSGVGGGDGTLYDGYLTLYDAQGRTVAIDDDSGAGSDPYIQATVTESGYYFVEVSEFSFSETGSYLLQFDTIGSFVAPETGTLDDLADYLVSGYWNDIGDTARSFDLGATNQITVDLSDLTSDGQQLARWALQAWELYADIKFVESSSFSADIVFDDYDSGAYSTSTVFDGKIYDSYVNVDWTWISSYGNTLDSYMFQTYIHEIGHALGLGHQGNYNGEAAFPIDATFLNDSSQLSVMSYFSQEDNTSVTATEANLATLMMADIIAIQSMYGASSATNGDTTWGANSNLGGYLATIWNNMAAGTTSSAYSGGAVAMTIYDNGGTDTLDLSPATDPLYISLVQETFSNVGNQIGIIGIARDAVIENAIGGSGHDTIIGNSADNWIDAGNGRDSVEGVAGNDTFVGGLGNDTLNGGAGTDIINYSSVTLGMSVYLASGSISGQINGANFRDTIVSIEGVVTGGGDDLIYGTSGANSISGGGGADEIGGGSGDDLLRGNAGLDTLWGADGNDTMYGGTENDQLGASSGNDAIYGEAGDDVLWSSDGNDLASGGDGEDEAWGGSGRDTVSGGDGDDLIGGGADNDTVMGGAGFDTIWGGTGDDSIEGGTEDDQIGGGLGDDTILGGAGDDVIWGSRGADLIYGDDGADEIWSGDDNDTIFGGAGDDIIGGGLGANWLDGGSGNDNIHGGAGSDVFVFSAGTDQVHAWDTSDRIDLTGVSAITSFADLTSGHLTQSGANAVISDGMGNSLSLLGVSVGALFADDFIF